MALRRYRYGLFACILSLLFCVLLGGLLFWFHQRTAEKHLGFARELLLKETSVRFTSIFDGYFYWDAMVQALQEKDREFLQENFEEIVSPYNVKELFLEKNGAPLFRFGTPLLEEKDLLNLKRDAMMLSLRDGDVCFLHKFPVLSDEGEPSGYFATVALENKETLKMINRFLGMHIIISPKKDETLFSIQEMSLREEHALYHFFDDSLTLHLLMFSFVLMAILIYGTTTIIMQKHSLETQLMTMSLVLEKRDSYTAHHSCKVADNARRIAQEMGLPLRKIRLLVKAGFLHDIGKLFTPDSILLKKGRLTEEEFSIIKAHPSDGADMVENILKNRSLASIIRQHHERYDGSGYPQGIKEDKTLLEARILAVADVIDAMLSNRPYHPPRSVEEVRDHLTACRGSLYDPDVADAALKILHIIDDPEKTAPREKPLPTPLHEAFFTPPETKGGFLAFLSERTHGGK